MADVSKIKLGATTYNIKDEGAARSSHTHPTSIATSTGTNELTMAHGGKYALTAGGDSFIFTLPADSNTDTKVTQTATTTSANYEVLFSATADNTNRTEGARKSANLLFNPSTGALTFGNATTAQLISKTPSRTAAFLTIGGSKKTAGDANGTAIRLGAGGATFIGGGEYADNRYNVADIADGDENLYMGADGSAYIETNAQTIGSRKTFTFGTDGSFNSPSTIKQNGTAVSLSGHTHGFTPAGTIAVQTAGATNNTLKPVTAKTVVTGGSTTAVPNISKKTVVTAASIPENVGTSVTKTAIATSAVSSEVLDLSAVLTNVVLNTTATSITTGDSVTIGTAINAYTSLTTGDSVTLGTAVTVKTGDAAYKFTGTAGTTS